MIIHKTEKHLYAQVINLTGNVVASISSLKEKIKGYNIEGAKKLGELFSEKIKEFGKEYVYDICGHRYDGRICVFIESLGFISRNENSAPINKKSIEKKVTQKKENKK